MQGMRPVTTTGELEAPDALRLVSNGGGPAGGVGVR